MFTKPTLYATKEKIPIEKLKSKEIVIKNTKMSIYLDLLAKLRQISTVKKHHKTAKKSEALMLNSGE